MNPPRQVPPYLPISCSGLMTRGSCPIRSATGGSLPALTSAASCGASFSVLGTFAGSVTTSGPSSLPIKPLLPALCASAPAATAALSTPTTSVIMSRDRTLHLRGVRLSSVMCVPPPRCQVSVVLAFHSRSTVHLDAALRPSRWGPIIVIFPRQVQAPGSPEPGSLTRSQALGALLFLYREVLEQNLPWLDDVVRAPGPSTCPSS